MKAALLFVFGLLVVSGCRARLADQRDVSIAVGEIVTVPIDAVSRDQTIQVVAQSPGKPIHVHVYLQENEEAIERAITLGKEPEKLLANALASEEVTLQAAVPADKVAVVRLQTSGPHSANVHLELSN